MATLAAGKLDLSAGQQSLAAMMAQAGVVNGWDAPSLWPSPKRQFVPAHWSYPQACTILDAAGAVVSTKLAERPNIILAHPIPGNRYAPSRPLVSAYQMVKPGETARSHRHSANALRLVLDTALGMYTIVEGRRIPMMPGDVLLTPNWHWRGHSNESNANGYWLDFLDVPLVHLLGPMFFEYHPAGIERDAPPDAGSPMRFPWETISRRLADAPELVPGRREIALEMPALATIGFKVMRMARRSSFRPWADDSQRDLCRDRRRGRLRRRRARLCVGPGRRDRRPERLHDDLPHVGRQYPPEGQRRTALRARRLTTPRSGPGLTLDGGV